MKIKQGKPGFSYGNCFVVAIGQAFNIRQSLLQLMFELIGVENFKEGASTSQCNKVIEKLAQYRRKDVKYVSLKPPKLMIEFIVNNKKGKFLLNSDEHVCYLRNGKLLDSFYHGDRQRLTEDRIIGYWEIKDRPEAQIVPDWVARLRTYAYSTQTSTK